MLVYVGHFQYWKDNRESMVNFLLKAHAGLKGLVKDEEEKPIVSAKVQVDKLKAVTTTSSGEFWKLVMPGNYTVVSWGYCGKIF